jgi:hypothetical protein
LDWYRRGAPGTYSGPYSSAACRRAAFVASDDSDGLSVRI